MNIVKQLTITLSLLGIFFLPQAYSASNCEVALHLVKSSGTLSNLGVLVKTDCAVMYKKGWLQPSSGGVRNLALCKPAWNSLRSADQLANARYMVANKCPDIPGVPICINTVAITCGFYSQCMEATCACKETNYNYAMAYGNKYCNRFLVNQTWSAKGNKWRDLALRCLQEEAIRVTPTSQSSCNCKKLSEEAYNSHINCYTAPFGKKENGICHLPGEDIRRIRKIIDTSDAIFSAEGLKAMKQIIQVCAQLTPDDKWKLVREGLMP